MMTNLKFLFLLILILNPFKIMAFDELDITSDSRIKTYIYNSNEVYLLNLHYGFQSYVEFAKGEEIETIYAGNNYYWKITPLDRRLFIRPLEKNIRTNLTVITNKRTYNFDLVSQEYNEDTDDSNLVYTIRFVYPQHKMK